MAGRATININGTEFNGAFINIFKGFQSPKFASALDNPTMLDDDGYPITTLNANLGGSVPLSSTLAANGIDFVLKWPAGRVIKFVINNAVTKSSVTGATVSGGVNGVMTVTTTGVAGRIVFQWNNYASSSFSFYFPSGFAHQAGTGELAMMVATDETAYDNGDVYRQQFIDLMTDLNPKIIRTMGMVNEISSNYQNHTLLTYRAKPTAFSWNTQRVFSGTWGGTLTGTDTYTMPNLPANSTSSWVDGEVFQAYIGNANTSTTPTLSVTGKTGSKTIVGISGGALNVGSMPAGWLATFIYDGMLDQIIYRKPSEALAFDGGITGGLPVEIRVALAKKINTPLWTNFPAMAQNGYISYEATYIRDNMPLSLDLLFGYGNEIWNNNFPLTLWADKRGAALSFPSDNVRQRQGWYALRYLQIMAIIEPIFSGYTNLKRVIEMQGAGDTNGYDTYRFQAADLSTSLGYTGYNSLIGVSYTAVGNRPIDHCDILSYGTYYQGASYSDGFGYDAIHSPAANIAILQSMIDKYTGNGGSPDIDGAKALLDTDIRSGTNTGYSVQTLLNFSGGIYPAWEVKAAKYSKPVYLYEGGLQCLAPTSTQCGTLGLVSPNPGGTNAAAATALASLLVDFKNDVRYGPKILTDQFNQFMAQSHSTVPVWFTISNSVQWGLFGSSFYTTPYGTYYAFKNYNNRKRRIVW